MDLSQRGRVTAIENGHEVEVFGLPGLGQLEGLRADRHLLRGGEQLNWVEFVQESFDVTALKNHCR